MKKKFLMIAATIFAATAAALRLAKNVALSAPEYLIQPF
jgi:hypothetical protein